MTYLQQRVTRSSLIAASFAVAASVCLVSIGVGTTPAAAQSLLDANCPEPSNAFVIVPAGDRSAETFTAHATGSLARGELLVNKVSGSGDFLMQIVAADAFGNPTETVLASTTIPDSSVPATGSTNPVRIAGSFTAPASVVAGQGYAIVISRPGASFNVHERGSFCPGQEFRSTSGGQWTTLGIGDYDLIFAVFVTPPAPSTSGPTASPTPTCKGRTATITGTEGVDKLSGTPAADVIAALGGNDKRL